MEDGVNPQGNSTGALTLDQGAELMANLVNPKTEEAANTKPQADAAEPDQANERDETEQVLENEQDEAEPEGEADEPDASDSDDEPEVEEPEQPQKIRLKDGTEVTLEEVNNGFMRDADYRQKTMALATEKKEVAGLRTDLTQKAQFFEQNAEFAIQLAMAHLPQQPDQSLIQTDPIGFLQQKAFYDQRIAELQQLHEAKQASEQQRIGQENEARRERLVSELEAARSKMPELQDKAKYQKFHAELKQAAQHYGFSDGDVDAIEDHRLLLMAKDAMAYRRLQAAKPKVQQKVQNVPQVQKPGRRIEQNEAQSRNVKEKWAKLSKTGSLEAGGELLLELTKGR